MDSCPVLFSGTLSRNFKLPIFPKRAASKASGRHLPMSAKNGMLVRGWTSPALSGRMKKVKNVATF
jgi:hypothetical protein